MMTPLIAILNQNLYKLMNEVLVTSADEWEVFNNTRSVSESPEANNRYLPRY